MCESVNTTGASALETLSGCAGILQRQRMTGLLLRRDDVASRAVNEYTGAETT